MSNLFKQISQEANLQRAQISQAPSPIAPQSPTPAPAEPITSPTLETPLVEQSALAEPQLIEPVIKEPVKPLKKVVPQSGAVAPKLPSDSPKLDLSKLKIIIEEISQMPTNSNGLNVRMSEQEMQDIEDFILITLRKQGLRGYDVSIAKLMRYALRYMFRVHEKEFISALKQTLQTEETLSI